MSADQGKFDFSCHDDPFKVKSLVIVPAVDCRPSAQKSHIRTSFLKPYYYIKHCIH